MKSNKIGVCGIGCEKCPQMRQNKCPNGENGCTPKENKFCKLSTCAFKKNIRFCFECIEFPCELTRKGPISYGFCQYITGKK